MAVSKVICVLSLLVPLLLHNTSGTDSSSLLGDSTSELNSLFGNNFQSDLQSQSLAYTHGNDHQRFADNRQVTGSEENDEDQVRNPKLDLLETDKNGQLEGEDESFYTESSQKRNKLDEVESNAQESDSSPAAIISKDGVHFRKRKVQIGFQNSPGVRRIMLLKTRATAKENTLNDQDENEDDHESQDNITKMTMHNILYQAEESDKKLGDKNIQKRASVDTYKETKTVETSGSAETPDTDVEASGNLEHQSKDSLDLLKGFGREQESETKGEPELSENNLRALSGQGSGDFQHSGSGDTMLDNFLDKVTIVSGDSTKVIPGRRGPKRESSRVTKNARSGAHFNHTRGIARGEGSGESVSGKMYFDPVLLFQIRNIRTNVLNAEKQATKELNDVRQEFRAKMEDLEEDLRMVRKLTSNVHNKVGLTVTQALRMARQAKTNATNRLHMARRAATALNNIEKKLGVIHTINASRILRSRIPEFPKLNDVALYKQVLATNAILTKLDGAKALAVYRAEKRFRNEEEMGSSIEEEVDSLRDELASAEKGLSEETDKELEDEREAQEKLQEAMERNKLVAKKTAFALTAIENYLEKLQSDEIKLKRFRF